LQNKLKGREDLVRQLRRYIALELVQIKFNGPEESRLKNIEANKDESLKILVLGDEITKLHAVISSKNTDINKLKYVIAYQADKVKRLIINEDKISFLYKDKLRKVEKERNLFKNTVQSHQSEAENLKLSNDCLLAELQSAKAVIDSKTFEIETNEKLITSLHEAIADIKSERDRATKCLHDTEYDWESLNEEVSKLKEKNKKLSTK